MSTDAEKQSELLWHQAIDDAASTGDYTPADMYALQARLAAEQPETMPVVTEGEPFLTPAELKLKEDSIILHDGLISYMLAENVDTTYIIVANRQFKLDQSLIGIHDPKVREKLYAEFDTFARDNQDQIDRTNAIRRQYAIQLASE